MKRVSVSGLTKEIHFPIVRAVVSQKKTGWLYRVKKFLTYRRKWEVMFDYIIWSEYLQAYIFVPTGFIFDGASVPKALYMAYSPNGILLLGACPHDEGYRYEGLILVNPDTGELVFRHMPKAALDKVFEELCARESGLPFSARIATNVLSIAGFIGWAENRKKAQVFVNDFPEIFLDIEL